MGVFGMLGGLNVVLFIYFVLPWQAFFFLCMATMFICLEMKWSKGGEAEYLNAGKDGAIVLSDPADGPITTTLNTDKSKTDLFNISVGIGF